ncbi:SDR family oxidoreductase [Sorangium sp. So ce117]|uniref:SDR family oxidoreductase n=1 Tax=Sorangium sp. So ce117 TaxID=3133277 RepID=UPI003F62B407
MAKLNGKVAVVTGGSDGIGLATAKLFVAEGATVYVTGRRQERLDEAVEEIGGGAVGVQGDVANLADLDRLFARIRREQGKLDVVFANAGISGVATMGAIDEDHFDRIFGANVKGLLFTVQKALPLMKRGGVVVLNGSMSGSKGFPNQSVYNATKAAVRSFARTWTTDLRGSGIRVNVVSAGAIDTPGMRRFVGGHTAAAEAQISGLSQSVPLGRFGGAEEVAKAVLYLASDDSSYVAGAELFVDGGVVAV